MEERTVEKAKTLSLGEAALREKYKKPQRGCKGLQLRAEPERKELTDLPAQFRSLMLSGPKERSLESEPCCPAPPTQHTHTGFLRRCSSLLAIIFFTRRNTGTLDSSGER